MKKTTILSMLSLVIISIFLTQCNNGKEKEDDTAMNNEMQQTSFGGYASQEQWGEHLVAICGCNDCHTPKKMGPMGPEPDMSLMLSGHPAQMPIPDVDRKMMETKQLAVTQDLTSWVGPWGVSYTANLTSDATGIGSWQESDFMTAIRDGKFKGMANGRALLPPMPWQSYRNMTDDELKAVFAFLKSTKPINNVVPAAEPPVMAGHM